MQQPAQQKAGGRAEARIMIDGRNRDFLERGAQPFNQRINNIIDRYSFMVETLRARVLAMFGELELDQLSLALKPLEIKRCPAVELRRLWLIGLPRGSDAAATLARMEPVEVIALADALEGRTVNLNSPTQ